MEAQGFEAYVSATLPFGKSWPKFDVGVRRIGNLSFKLELRSFSVKFEISYCIFPAKKPKTSENETQTL